MRRKYLFVAVAVVLLLVGGEFVYWRIAAERLRNGYHDWLAAMTQRGWEVSSGAASISGWPRAAAVVVPNVALRHPGAAIPGDVQVALAGVTLSVSLLRPVTLRISMTGPAHVRVAGLQDVV